MARKTALLIVDFQNDFCEGGALPVQGGRSLAKPINELIASQKWDLVIASKDWHPEGHVSFASAHPQTSVLEPYELIGDNGSKFTTTLWPDHCINGTTGAEIVEGLNISELDNVVYKGQHPEVEFYSAFSDVFGKHTTDLEDILRRKSITDIVVIGLAFDFCVMHTALDAARKGFQTTVNTNCTRSISEESEKEAIKRLKEAGVSLQ